VRLVDSHVLNTSNLFLLLAADLSRFKSVLFACKAKGSVPAMA